MDQTQMDRLGAAAVLWATHRTPSRLAKALRNDALAKIEQVRRQMQEMTNSRIADEVDVLAGRGIDVSFVTDPEYPVRLRELTNPPPVLFTWGNKSLLSSPGVGMCGSRHATARGLKAAKACGLEVADHGLVIISGYAKGVDTETHLAALASGGRTVIILAEGILHFRKKRVFDSVGLDPDRVVVVSQFAPNQRWNVGAAMTRNAAIASLGRALVVVEASEKGGTLNAGLTALRLGRPVIALDFGEQTPPGNKVLFDQGAIRVTHVHQLSQVIQKLSEISSPTPEQLELS